ncbi:MAG: xanthine dehydrogenase family protein molybdopterin-binding subunit [Bacillota bacterium]|nr:xanthine dehydrogenase family protein molybdopterin-binding subunit [Bacillota bacterium]
MKITDQVYRVDIQSKLNGSVKYIEDVIFENLHYARTLRSSIPRGKILSVSYPDIIEGITIVDKTDIIDKNEVSMIETDMPIFADKEVNYVGEPIALIVGKDKNQVIEFFNKIIVEYEPLEAVLSMGGDETFSKRTYTKGDLSKYSTLEEFSGHYKTTYQEQLYMEKQGVVANYVDERIEIYGSMQCPYYVKNALINALGFDENRIRIVQTTTGGAFGGKEDYPSLMACQTALASIKIGAPVRLIFDRREDIIFTTKRHPSETGITSYLENGKIKGMKIDVELDAGPYLGLSDVVLQRAILTMTGAYQIENLEVNGIVYKTNNIFNGAFRGFGGPQSLFALEQHMTQLANHLGKDPLDLRREYFVQTGQLTSTNGIFHENIYLDKMADKLEEISDYKNPKKESDNGNLVGYGFAIVPHGGGFTGDGEAAHIKAVVKLKKDTEGLVHILVSNVEMGQGALTTLSKIVASTLDISLDKVFYKNPDTDVVPDSGPTAASRTTMVIGKLLYEAAVKLREVMDVNEEIIITEHYKQPPYIEWDQDTLQGNAYLSYSWAALLARVEVDPMTFEVSCTDIYGIYDVGIPVDEKLLLGQVHGGVIQGMGYAMMEAMYSIDGKIQQNSFASYAVPTTVDVPNIHSDWIINEYEDGPFGAKAAGELTLVGVAPAIASAVADAIGKNIYEIPVLPEKILEVTK